MNAKEGRGLAIPENGKIQLVDPTTLMQGNPAALIVNRESYRRMAAHFDPNIFDLPQVVRVTVYSPEGAEERVLVVDGLTRIKFAADHVGQTLGDHTDFRFDQLPVRDVTVSYLRNPVIVGQNDPNSNRRVIP